MTRRGHRGDLVPPRRDRDDLINLLAAACMPWLDALGVARTTDNNPGGNPVIALHSSPR